MILLLFIEYVFQYQRHLLELFFLTIEFFKLKFGDGGNITYTKKNTDTVDFMKIKDFCILSLQKSLVSNAKSINRIFSK